LALASNHVGTEMTAPSMGLPRKSTAD